ncbi:MAG: hypothetical protein K0Q53_520 [Massilibacillus sp.]|jgi:hypothetical protein|nr:hypothetical protein [Massilibacillus sp.]
MFEQKIQKKIEQNNCFLDMSYNPLFGYVLKDVFGMGVKV